jgi:hypothetical protein
VEGKVQERNTAHKKLKVLRDVQFLLDRLFPVSKLFPLTLNTEFEAVFVVCYTL